ncbi:TonB family protein [Cellulophaga geojensis KL-A]|uniref:TonB family protein n=1 Tax=Cellulophaga geojensis KL-A TaxID=1328323 RepID=A0ABN0RTM5_9FLAO|nr:energy transducer TonB [Cellulophaga geojensis]EWH15251.1 TonB family protein [Cellulophaga geojensis KL-A]
MKTNTENSVGFHGNGNNRASTNATPKKSKHDANLRKNSFLNFQIGLVVAMGLVYLALESSYAFVEENTTKPVVQEREMVEYHPDLNNFKVEEDKPKVKVLAKTVVNPDKIKITPDNAVEDFTDFIDDTESDPEEPVAVSSIVEHKIIEDPIIPLDVVEEVPIFPGCEKVAKEKRKDCFNEKMQKHVKRYFRYPDAAIEMREQGRVSVMFKIGTDGVVKDVQMRGPSKILEKEAQRIISKLPQMTPGKQGKSNVVVPYSIPINFKLE